MKIGGITNIDLFAKTNQHKWKDQSISFSKYKPSPAFLNPHQRKRLTSLSLWARAKIVYGNENNFDSLSRADVEAFSDCEICHLKSSAEEKPIDLTAKISFEEWSASLLRSLHHELNEEGVTLAYVLRKPVPPKKFTSLHEQLEYLLPTRFLMLTFAAMLIYILRKLRVSLRMT